MLDSQNQDDQYFQLIRDAIAVCRHYKPKSGKGSKAGFTLSQFQELYQQDPFYTWFGLDSALVYAAHRAAGGMTSVYRQIGIACERLFRQVLQDSLGLDEDEAKWSYSVPASGGGQRKLSLDGRIPLDEIRDAEKSRQVRRWLRQAATSVNVEPRVIRSLRGPVFEVRQGYKSKDAKRQNADIGNAANAYANSYLPAVVLLSIQIDSDIAERYSRAQWVILRGTLEGSPLQSTYAFSRDVLGYDLAGFSQRNTDRIRSQIQTITEALLK